MKEEDHVRRKEGKEMKAKVANETESSTQLKGWKKGEVMKVDEKSIV